MFRLKPVLEKNEWGKSGSRGMLLHLARASLPEIRENAQVLTRYSELWVGSTPTQSCEIATGTFRGKTLGWYFANFPDSLGAKHKKNFPHYRKTVPYCLSVVTLGKATPLTVHPTETLARELFNERIPNRCVDCRSKHKLIVALNHVTLACGFKNKQDIINVIKGLPHFLEIVGHKVLAEYERSVTREEEKEGLQSILLQILVHEENDLAIKLIGAVRTVIELDEQGGCSLRKHPLYRIHAQYPGDRGCFIILLMNNVLVKPGEAAYIKPRTLYSVLTGNFLQCSSNSDNNFYAGLCDIPKDASALLHCIDVTLPCGRDDLILKPFAPSEDLYQVIFRPPTIDFCLERITIPSLARSYVLEARDSPSVVVVVSGFCSIITSSTSSLISDMSLIGLDEDGPLGLQAGYVLFVEANQPMAFTIGKTQMLIFRIYPNKMDA